jgi:hypothetical protein
MITKLNFLTLTLVLLNHTFILVDFITQEEAKTLINSWLDQNLSSNLIQQKLSEHGFLEIVSKQMINEVISSRKANIKPPEVKITQNYQTPITSPPPPPTETPPPLPKTEISTEKIPDPQFSNNSFNKLIFGQKKIFTFIVIVIISLLLSIKPSYIFTNKYHSVFQDTRAKIESTIREIFPKDLEINIEKGTVSTNVTEPYYINISQSTIDELLPNSKNNSTSNFETHLLVIDTKGKAEDFERYQSVYLLTKNSLIYYKDGQINIKSLRNIQNQKINQQYVLNQIEKFKDIISFINSAFYFTPILIFIATLISISFKILFLSLVIFFILQIKIYKISFFKIFQFVSSITCCYLFFQLIIIIISPLSPLNPESISNPIIIALSYFFFDKNQATTNT